MASIKIYSKEQVDGLLPTIVQSTGSSTSDIMSQKAVTDNLPSSSQLIPSGGTDGQVLTKVSGSPAWANASSGGVTGHTFTTALDLFNAIDTHPECQIMIKNIINNNSERFVISKSKT